MGTHVYITSPANWTEQVWMREAPICDSCGLLCRRWRWVGKKGTRPGQWRCAPCDEAKRPYKRSEP